MTVEEAASGFQLMCNSYTSQLGPKNWRETIESAAVMYGSGFAAEEVILSH